MFDHDRVQLLSGPYNAPGLRRGERATCLSHNTVVVITGWTFQRISCAP
jgi:hypothetical protein